MIDILVFFLFLNQAATKANERYQTEQGRQAVAQGLSAPNRDQRQKPEELVSNMHLAPGMTVADIGSGTGYMLPYLSKAVGPSGKVVAEDIFDDFLAKAKATAAKASLANVTFLKGGEKDPGLPPASLDAILALDSYHHYNYPKDMLAGFHRGLKPNGRLTIVEYYRTPEAMPDAVNHIRLDKPGVIAEVEANGFRLLSDREQIPHVQYMVTFAPK